MEIDNYSDCESASCDDANDDEPNALAKAETAIRHKKLGFVPQKENFCNKYLPYASELDDESQRLLAELKEALARAVALREMTPSIGYAMSRLLAYIKLYGLKFSKEDHVKFIKLLLALIEIPDLEPAKLNKLCIALSQLLRKTAWLSPDDIQIDWKPLYSLSNTFLNKNSTKGEIYRYFPSLETNVQFIIQQCAPYFPRGSTQEILNEIYPKLFPLDTGKVCGAFDLLSIFLNPLEDYNLWLPDFMNLWNTYHNPSWNVDIMNLLAITASQNVGYIDWEPYMPMIFTRILRSLNLPVAYKNIKSMRNQTLWTSSVAIWIASVLSPKSSAQEHLTKLLVGIETYLHPANSGKWDFIISEILVQLPKYLFDRLVVERYKPHPWKRPPPAEHCLTEDCLTAFVKSFKAIALQAMYSRLSPTDIGRVFKHLADLRPELIIPDVIDRVYVTLESVTEPHKMTAALQCLVSVSRAMVSGHNGYTFGKTHVIPILFATLPGIDPNDFKKTSVTLQFLTTFALMVPIVDCSKAPSHYDDLTEDEQTICGQTAQFEDFALAYLDKVFAIIDSSSHDVIRMEQNSNEDNTRSKLESLLESLLQSSTHGIFGQCSEEIIASAAHKFVEHVKGNLFEPRVAAHLIASLVRVFARVAGTEINKSLVPFIIERINRYIDEHEDLHLSEKQSDEMLYYMIITMAFSRGVPNEVVNFAPKLIPIIDKVSHFKCKLTNKYSNAILLTLLSNMSTLQVMDVRSSPESQEKPLTEFLPIRHWGQKMKANSPLKWFVPDEKAREVCQMILHRYLLPILKEFDDFVDGAIELTRDDILRDTSTVLALLKCANFLPNWTNEEPIEVWPTKVPFQPMNIKLGYEHLAITMPDGGNVRLAIIRSISRLQKKILADFEDDTKSLKAIILIWDRVFIRKNYVAPFESQLKSYNQSRVFQDYKLTKHVRDIRALLATRILMQQDGRDELSLPVFTRSHLMVMENLLALSTSHYSAVRATAQSRLFKLIGTFPFSYRRLLPEIERYLALDSNENHESFKGILYVICGQRRARLIVKNDWVCVQSLWLSLLKTNLSEKPSVIRLIDMAYDVIHNEFPTVNVGLHVSDVCVELAKALLPPTAPPITDEEIAAGLGREQALNESNLKMYMNILREILNITHNNSLHWRYGLIASGMIFNLVHISVKYPDEVIYYCVHNLINESIEERNVAVKIMRFIFKQHKREHIKVPIDPFKMAGIPRPANMLELKPGFRSDNRWLQYELATLPHSQAEWDEPRFMHKYEGFFGWSPNFSVYAPSAQQPPLNRTRPQLTSSEQIIYDFLSNQANVDKLIEFWSLEEKKGFEKFNRSRSFFFKGVGDMFGDVLLGPFLTHLRRLIENKNSESSHRCAAEILAGIIRGMKHWPYQMSDDMYQKLLPLIRLALSSITTETDHFWGTCFATAAENVDPRRQHWLHEALLENPLLECTSFVDCSRVYCLQGPFNQHVWRMNSVSHRLLEYLRPHLNHMYQNVRERLGSVLINIFEADLRFVDGPEPECPRIKDMITEVVAKIEIMQVEDVPKIRQSYEDDMDDEPEVSAKVMEYHNAVRLFKTICQWIVGVLNRNTNGNRVEYFELLPVACRMERADQDTELGEACSSLLAMLSNALTLHDCMGTALRKIDEVSQSASWSSRLSVTEFLQVLIFNNMPIVLSRSEWVLDVQTIVLRLLEDSVVEVRAKAAQVLGGLLHCSFLPSTDKLLTLFKEKCRTKIVKNAGRRIINGGNDGEAIAGSSSNENADAEAIRTRHMGVLGLCSFVSAYPYELPDFIPVIFEHLGKNLNDPQPIPSTIRIYVGDFKRTHQDNWAMHKLKFTEDQLAVLNDLTIPPSYYA